jgi:uncharacterized protein YndB with AHSA1/START domain
MNGTLLREGDSWTLRFERRLAHPIERVWRAVTEPSELAHWFPGKVEIDLVVGGKMRFGEPGLDVDSELLPTQGLVTALDPPRLFAFTWADEPLRFELTPDGDGCVLVFTHTFENRAGAPRFAAGWTECLDALLRMLGHDAPPSGRRWPEYFQRFIDELGQDGTFKRDGETAVLRFERLVNRPVEDVWAALTKAECLQTWLADADFDAREGTQVELRFANPPGYVVKGRVTTVEPLKVLEYTWTSPGEPDGAVKWQLIPAEERCLLLLTHTVHGRWDAAGTLAAWHVHLALLATALADQPAWPFPDVRWNELRAAYACAVTS